jgi:tRNA pseudouridine(55) synthase
VLGLLRETTQQTIPSNVNVIVNTFVKNHIGKQKQDYPPYSSKTVQGKPLFLWAKEGRLDHITIPTRSIEIMKFDVLSFDALSKEALQHKIITNIGSLKGDFRQELILKRWETFFQKTSQQSFMTAKFHIACSSGTYVRGFVHELGALLGCGAVTIDILRTRAGNFRLDDLSNA